VCVHAYYRKYLWDPCETVVPRTTVASRVQQVVTKTWHFLCITGAQHDGFQPSGMQTAISLHVIFVTIIIYIWHINSVLWCLSLSTVVPVFACNSYSIYQTCIKSG